MMSNIAMEPVEHEKLTVAREPRFAFGKNWQRFLRYLDEERIAEAQKSLREMLGVENLKGRSFLDIGSGSGLFSLAAMRLGASRVHSFDYDPDSVACARELKSRFFPLAGNWSIEQGSVLDRDYLGRLGQFDVVYSWGVLHHTGNMWQALENVVPVVARQGTLFIAIYNDQRLVSTFWRMVKRIYNRSSILRLPIVVLFGFYFSLRRSLVFIFALFKIRLSHYRRYKEARGMSFFADLIDWLGGYPFEVAKPEDVFIFFREKGFELLRLKTVGGALGCNEFVFLNRRQSFHQ